MFPTSASSFYPGHYPFWLWPLSHKPSTQPAFKSATVINEHVPLFPADCDQCCGNFTACISNLPPLHLHSPDLQRVLSGRGSVSASWGSGRGCVCHDSAMQWQTFLVLETVWVHTGFVSSSDQVVNDKDSWVWRIGIKRMDFLMELSKMDCRVDAIVGILS